MTAFSFSFSSDTNLIKEVLLSYNNIPFNFDDTFEDPTTFNPPICDKIRYIEVKDGSITQGFFFLIDKNGYTECHMAFLPIAYGKVHAIGRECIKWVWDNTDIQVMVAPCIETNTLALRCIQSFGFTIFHKQEDAWLRDGIWHHYLWLKLERCHNIRDEV